ncbi:alpha/beta hydrolase fold domain-containing protein [Paenibacillus sacheonensis]|uniref:Alpha/beta hydrolase fold domain-containing protein n=1 Tax=Paenibacillus sacheonensis TaxID=742054 RepID=A0A7X5C454_9BACL|nr:alpha/beta hydrolase [Paenibacillus sacheonensis]NBC72975.1 alpha/beta hydrolase fold domain-containing protein [Paenibacillus sacheonensis]
MHASIDYDDQKKQIWIGPAASGHNTVPLSNKAVLEPAAQKFVEDTANPPYLFDLGPEAGRKAVDQVQSGDVEMPDVDLQHLTIPGGPKGSVSLTIVRPKDVKQDLPVILYTHGAGWVFGDALTHGRLISELAVGSQSAVVFTNYDLSPEAKYPVAIEEIYNALLWVASDGKNFGLDSKEITVAGDSVGGNMSAAITLMAKDRNGPKISKQLLFYPVTDASFDTPSYQQFATGYFLRQDAMKWFWNQYTTDPKQRNEIYASPLRATIDQLKGLPEALIITAEADVLRDEGEAYANKLREAGVPVTAVRFQGIIHDFVMLNALKDTNAARGAMLLANSWLSQ